MTEPKQMDPDRLAVFRQWIDTDPPGPIPETFKGGGWVRELLDHADFWEAEAKRLRPRARVHYDDAGRLHVEQIEAWLRANGWAPSDGYGDPDDWWRVEWRPPPPACQGLVVCYGRSPVVLANTVNAIADTVGRPALDILDEMTAMEEGK
jgi:hypothetical protein